MSGAARLDGVDVARAVAIAGVVHLHLGPFRGLAWDGTAAGLASDLLALLARLAVPFFFVTAGYFFGRKLAEGRAPLPLVRRQASRLLTLYLVWSAAYVVVPALLHALNRRSLASAASVLRERVGWAAERPLTFLLQGPQEHLWFLPALGCGLLAAAWAASCRWSERATLAAGLGLYAVALAGGSYVASPLGLALGFNPRNGPFVSVAFVAAGVAIARREADGGRRGAALGPVLLGGGLLLALAEALALRRLYGRDLAAHDALLGLLLAGPGLFLVARHATGRPPAALVRVGRLTLGVYAAHMLLALPLSHAHLPAGAAGEIALPVLVYAATVLVVLAMARVPRLAPLVA